MKLIETTPDRGRTFRLELDEKELQTLGALCTAVRRGTPEGDFLNSVWEAASEVVPPPASVYDGRSDDVLHFDADGMLSLVSRGRKS